MKLAGLHLLLTYQCNFECAHCFVWGSPWQTGTMRLSDVIFILEQAQELGTIEWIYFEGGEPFLYFPILVNGINKAFEMGFRVGVVSNAYWGTCKEDALEWLKPLLHPQNGAPTIEDLSLSSDLFHYDEQISRQVKNATLAAEQLGFPIGVISIAQPNAQDVDSAVGKLPIGESSIMYRGRAAVELASTAPMIPWNNFTECPFEDLRNPERIHVDPLGYLHICQGISLGNIFQFPLQKIIQTYQPEDHPITGPLLDNGPVALVERYKLQHQEGYADACHLCYEARRSLRERFPEVLTPDQMYGIF